MIRFLTYVDDDEVEHSVPMPASWHICSTCEGKGKSSAYLGAFTGEEWAEQGEEFKTDYMDGLYDRPCEQCKGEGKVLLIDEDELSTPEQNKAYAQHLENAASDREDQAMIRAEMRLLGDWQG